MDDDIHLVYFLYKMSRKKSSNLIWWHNGVMFKFKGCDENMNDDYKSKNEYSYSSASN